MCKRVKSKFDWLHRATKRSFVSQLRQHNIAYLEFFPIYHASRRDALSIGNREGRLFSSGGVSKIGKPIKRDNSSPRSEEREDEEEEKKDNEGRGRSIVKTSSVLRMGRKCLIAVRGSSRRWRNWFKGAYQGKDEWTVELNGSGPGWFPRESVNVSICTADN